MPTIKVVKAFNLLTATNAKPQRFEVGEHDVSDEIANHWYVQAHLEKPEPEAQPFDPATASRDELSAFLHSAFMVHLGTLSDDELRDFAIRQKGAAEAAADEGQGQGQGDDAGSADGDAAARKAEIRDQLKAMGAELPHHNAGLDKHEAALDAAQAAKADPQPEAQPEIPVEPKPEAAAAETAAA